MKKITPTLDFVYVKELKDKSEKQGSIYVVSQAPKDYRNIEVIATGPGTYQNGILIPPDVKVGDKYLFMIGTMIIKVDEDDDANYFMMKAYELMGKVEE